MAIKNPYAKLDMVNTLYFDKDSIQTIEDLAKGMDVPEVLDYFGLDISDLDESINPNIAQQLINDKKLFYTAFRCGRTKGKHYMVNALFSCAAGGKSTKEASIAYLQRFGANWEPPDSSNSKNDNTNKNFSFTVQLDD